MDDIKKQKTSLYTDLLFGIFGEIESENINLTALIDVFIKSNGEHLLIENKKEKDQFIKDMYKRMNKKEKFFNRLLSYIFSLIFTDGLDGMKILTTTYNVYKSKKESS